ncbi:hypothetical protein Tsubulata_023322 [Turnera subulata]|uniref:CCHC-type domain-containing protein n=1 Tax=Turnera subulata TaxID=218843 RepID=A0A9Q0J930_9ROSI|nr:hypothetical protein Tsubulata_023322 [Turnera subulata]
MLCNRLSRLWGLRGEFRVIDLDQTYFLVRLADNYDYLRVMNGGPWVILDYYLTVEPWQLNFVPATHKVTSVVAWVRVPGLSMELYQLAILREVCNRIGRMIRIDYSTHKTEHGCFAKAAVELDISKPLETETCVDGVWYPIVYESLPQVCFSCGRAGHLMGACTATSHGLAAVNGSAARAVDSELPAGSLGPGQSAFVPSLAAGGVPSTKYGEWILVPPRSRPNNRKGGAGIQGSTKDGPLSKGAGSRFSVFGDVSAISEEGQGLAPVKQKVGTVPTMIFQGSKGVNSGNIAKAPSSFGFMSGKGLSKGKAKGVFLSEPMLGVDESKGLAGKRPRGASNYTLNGEALVQGPPIPVSFGPLANPKAVPPITSATVPVVEKATNVDSSLSSPMNVAFDVRGHEHCDRWYWRARCPWVRGFHRLFW